MRIVIDLQACQRGPSGPAAAIVALVRQLLNNAGPHQVVLALSSRYPASVASLRRAFADLLPPASVLLYELPPATAAEAADQPWLEQACVAIRAAFLAAQQADLLFVPGLLGAETTLDVSASSPLFPLPPCVMPAADAVLDAATLWQQFATVLASATATATSNTSKPTARPKLAYISPLPPEKSGIADYSAELLPQLAHYYDIDVILAQPTLSDAWVSATLPQRDVAWFETHAASYDRVLYHFGNSPMHQHMFALLERHPGVVVLHDFYLANLLDYMHHTGHSPDLNTAALYQSHGYTALLDRASIGDTAAVWKYPSNLAVLQQADGIIVHSQLPKQLASDWYGPAMAVDWQVLPLLRGLAGDSERSVARLAARAKLGLDPALFLVCSFGLLGPTKLNEELLQAWQQSPLADDSHSRLVFVGELSGGNYGRDLPAKIAAGKGKKRIQITGFVSAEQYQTYLAACDVAVQLRRNSRGETSAAVLDCLLHGVPTVANAHGSTAELPPEVLCLLPDAVQPEELAAALLRLRDDAALCQRLSSAAADYVRREHAPAAVGARYHATIEQFAQRSPQRQYRQLLATLAASAASASASTLRQVAAAIGANHLPPAPRQLLVDISAMVQTDLKTGIQRVVRSILMALIKAPPAGYRIEPVYSPGRGEPYRYARHYMQQMLLAPFDIADDAPLDTQAGDLFLGLDLMMHGTQQNAAQLQQLRARGVQLHFVVYDILPVLQPHRFPFGAEPDFAAWLATIADLSDGLLCISAAVADELAGWLAQHRPQRVDPLGIGYFHLGADIDASAPSFGLPDNVEQIMAQVASAPTLLMVGTVEPRKGHAQALAAFDLLWQQGVAVNLVIVGKHGWMVDEVARDLRNHPQQGKQLIWLSGVSDEMLLKLYHGAAGLLAASEGEGFGLPLIEAAQHGLPIVARDLPVFREVAGPHAHYFSGLTAEALAATMRDWLDLLQKDKVPASSGMPWLTWDGSTQALLATALQSQWRHMIHPENPLS